MNDASQPGAAARDHIYRLRVFYEDTDAGGVVYHANYLRFAERARTEWLRGCGITHRELAAESGHLFTVRRVEAEFLAPARLDDELEIRTTVIDHGGAQFAMGQVIRRGGDDLARLRVVIACVNAKGRATRLPKAVAGLLAAGPTG
jgi:acyl-CoA thioester hydrolase